MTALARYPVRCCCEPTKLYGYLELPAGLRSGFMTTVTERASLRMRVVREVQADDRPQLVNSPMRHPIKLMRVVDPAKGLDEVAVYSDDRPIEFWRKIVGFSELKLRPFTFHTIDPTVIAECEAALGTDHDASVMVAMQGADRRVVGRVKAVKPDQHRGWTDITIEELVPVERFERSHGAL